MSDLFLKNTLPSEEQKRYIDLFNRFFDAAQIVTPDSCDAYLFGDMQKKLLEKLAMCLPGHLDEDDIWEAINFADHQSNDLYENLRYLYQHLHIDGIADEIERAIIDAHYTIAADLANIVTYMPESPIRKDQLKLVL